MSKPLFDLTKKDCTWNWGVVMLDSHSGNKSDIFHHNNENNQLERRVQPPRDIIRCPVMDLSIPLE